MQDIHRMQLGQLVDFVIDFNNRNKREEKSSNTSGKPKKRKATQADIDAFFG